MLMSQKLTVDEIGARGGKSRSDRKLEASRKNLSKAKEVLNTKRLAKKQQAGYA
jgi:hypothetical protein